jgi:hypothetical protein
LVASPHHVRPLANRARKTESCSSPAFNALLQHYRHFCDMSDALTNVCNRGKSGSGADLPSCRSLTQSGRSAAKFAVMHNGPLDVVGMVVGSVER